MKEDPQRNIFCIVDGSSLLYRSYYGVRPLHTATGEATHAIYGFCRTLKKIIDELNPKYMTIIWDSKGPTVRHERYESYKANRQSMPSDLSLQKKKIIEFLSLIKIEQLAQQGLEADDLIYSLVTDLDNNKEIRPLIVTGDKDLYQLLTPDRELFDPFKQKIITYNSFIEERGFKPEELLLYHTLLGDSSDNIPGVKGIGKKRAEELTQKFHTLENLYNNIDQIEQKRPRTLIQEQKDMALLSQELFTLLYQKTDINLEQADLSKSSWENAHEFFHALEIRPFAPKNSALSQEDNSQNKSEKLNWYPVLITQEKELDILIKKLESAEIIALDTETTGLHPERDQLVGISLSIDPAVGYYIPFGHIAPIAKKEKNRSFLEQEPEPEIKKPEQLPKELVLEKLKAIFENKTIQKTLQNSPFDRAFLEHNGIKLSGITFDTLLAAYLLREHNEKIGLKTLSIRYLGEEMETFGSTTKKYKNFSEVPLEDAARYAGHDAVQTLKLTRVLGDLLEKQPLLKKLFYAVELPLSNTLYTMHRTGILLDTNKLKEIKLEVQAQLKIIIEKINSCLSADSHEIDPENLNLNSPSQLEVLLFDQLNLPVVKKSKTGKRSTDSEVLLQLSKIHPVPQLIIKYRELFKLLSTYLEPLPMEMSKKTKRIHTTYSQTIAATGRLSSFQPNLQNIPAGSGIGARVRDAFVAPPGYLFLSADYSQIELRILAHVTQDPGLLNAFAHNEDIHTKTAAQIFGVTPENITNDQRQVGKKINFSIMYGLTPFGLSKDLDISPTQAKEYIAGYFREYPGVQSWMDKETENGIKNGFVSTWFGRKRAVPGLREKNRNIFEAEKRVAINSPIQGTAADIIKIAMLKIERALIEQKLQSHLVLQIHDELVLAVDESEKEIIAKMVKTHMSGVVKWEVPLDVSLRWGRTWGEISK